MSIFYVPNPSGASEDRWNSQPAKRPVPSSASRPRTPGRVRSKSQAELGTPRVSASQIASEQETYAQEFQVDPQSMQMIMDQNSNPYNSNASFRYTLAADSIQQQKQQTAEEKRSSIYYGALRVPLKSAASAIATPGRAKAEPSHQLGLSTSARRVAVKQPAPSALSQTPRLSAVHGGLATPGRLSVFSSGASRMNTLNAQTHVAMTPSHQSQQNSVMASPSSQIKRPVYVEETYIRRLTYDEVEDDTHVDEDESQQYSHGETVAEQRMPDAARPSSTAVPEVPKSVSFDMKPKQIDAAPTIYAVPPQPNQVEARALPPIEGSQPTKSSELSRDGVEKKLIANQRRRREIMAELAKLDSEQMELINLLQTLPK